MAEDKVAAVSEWCSVGVDIWTGGVAAHGEDYDDAAGVERKVSSSNHRSDGQGGDCRPDIRFNQIDKGEKIEVGGARFEETRSLDRKALFTYKRPYPEGSVLMDVPPHGDIQELATQAKSREKWNVIVNQLNCQNLECGRSETRGEEDAS